ncbi:MAG: AMP-binding protein [Usitatibacter sp.]
MGVADSIKDPGLAALGGPPAAALLEIIAGLLRESQPAGGAIAAPALDSSLERDLGIDSLARAELLLRVERAFDVRLPEHLLGSAETPRDLLRAVLAGTRRGAEALAATPIAQPESGAVQAPDTRMTLVEAPEATTTLIEALDWHVARHPDRVHLLLLDEGEEGEPVTYGQLRTEAQAVAAGLARRGIGAAQAVAIMLPTGRDFFRAFMGILLAGAVPVPIYPPSSWARIEEHLRRQARILDNCRAVLLVTMAEGKRVARVMQALVPTLAHVATVADLAMPGTAPTLPVPRASDLALLQYTSGSTGDPKGVMLTHGNLFANIRAIGRTVGAGPQDVFVSWLPLYHDMGLIGGWLGGLLFGFPLVVMPPTAFLAHPARWLRAVHRYRGTLSSAPNFAYEICATRVDERDLEGIDLSSWRLAFNGAEPVSPGTLERFADRFARHGFRREALTPVFGLAECALGLTFPPLGRGPIVDRVERRALTVSGKAIPARGDDESALRFVGCGAPLPGHEIRIADAQGRELPERSEGRIEFRGPSATSGYFRNSAKTRELFDGDWLDTGDLGYIAGGELFVTSRAKDVIIRGGQHIHPYELESAVGGLAGVRKGCVAVFGVPDPATGTEKVVVLAETRLPQGAGSDALRASIANAALAILGTPADEVVIAPPHTVLKTSSGKIRRSASREAYVRGISRAQRPSVWRPIAAFVGSLLAARARGMARRAAQLAYGAYLWALTALLSLAALPAALLPGHWRGLALRALARALLRASGLPLTVQGLANIPSAGPVVIVSNHASYIDGLLLFALLPRRARIVAKSELAGNPVLRLLLRGAGVSFIERIDVERGAEDTRQLAELARQGEALVFFAEGTITRAPGLMPFHMGAFVTSAESAAPVVPVILRGTRSVLRDGQWLPRRAAIRVEAGAPQRAEGGDWRSAVLLRESVRAEILAGCGEPDLAARAIPG